MVYYDNYLVVTPDVNEAAEWRRRIERNSVELGVRIKEGSHHCLSTNEFCREGFDYLGIHFQGVKDRESDRRPVRLIWWPAKAAIWQVELEECQERLPSFSCRQVAQLIGRGVFGLIIGGKPLPHTDSGRRLLRVARTIGQRAHAKGWEAPAGDLATAAWASLEHVCQLRYEPHQAELGPKEKRPATPWVLTTDASKSGYGWVAFESVGGRLVAEEAPDRYAFKWQEATATQHIFLLEFHACLTALRVWRKRHPQERVIIVVDNAAVAFALRNGFSNNMVAMRLMESHAEDLAAMEDIVLVVSQDNPADCPSRGSLSDFGDRTERLERALDARRQGWNWASGPCSKYASEGKRPADRHLYVERLHDETEEEEERAEDVMLPLL